MKQKAKKPTFFCENCGSEVPENAKVCTHCGKFFSSVRCPQCSHEGLSKDFKDGCPECGYSATKASNYHGINYKNKTEKGSNLFKNFINKKYPEKNYSSKNESSLPVWIYVATAGILAVVVFASYSCFTGSRFY